VNLLRNHHRFVLGKVEQSEKEGADMRLNNGEHFPTITASRVGGGEMSIPQTQSLT
jgi:hypothetical protein